METQIDQSLDISINGFLLKAKTWGDKNNKNRILAIHGWLDNANSFDKIAPLIRDDYYLVAIDLAGHGLSNHREGNGNYYLWDHAVDILNCLDALNWKECTLIAHSLGSGVATLVAGSFPNRIQKLIFIDGLGAPFINDENETVSSFKTAFQQLKMAKKTRLYGFANGDAIAFKSKEEAIQDRMLNRISPISYQAAAHLIDRGLKPVSGGYRWSHDPKIVLPEHYKMTENQVRQFIESITCPTLIILGNQGLFATGLYRSRLVAFRHAEIHWIEGNHHLHLENSSTQVANLSNIFLEKTNN